MDCSESHRNRHKGKQGFPGAFSDLGQAEDNGIVDPAEAVSPCQNLRRIEFRNPEPDVAAGKVSSGIDNDLDVGAEGKNL